MEHFEETATAQTFARVMVQSADAAGNPGMPRQAVSAGGSNHPVSSNTTIAMDFAAIVTVALFSCTASCNRKSHDRSRSTSENGPISGEFYRYNVVPSPLDRYTSADDLLELDAEGLPLGVGALGANLPAELIASVFELDVFFEDLAEFRVGLVAVEDPAVLFHRVFESRQIELRVVGVQ